MHPIIKRVHELDDTVIKSCLKFSFEVSRQLRTNLVGLLEEGDLIRENNTTKLVTRVVKYRGDGQVDLVAIVTERIKDGEIGHRIDLRPWRTVRTAVAVDVLQELES